MPVHIFLGGGGGEGGEFRKKIKKLLSRAAVLHVHILL